MEKNWSVICRYLKIVNVRLLQNTNCFVSYSGFICNASLGLESVNWDTIVFWLKYWLWKRVTKADMVHIFLFDSFPEWQFMTWKNTDWCKEMNLRSRPLLVLEVTITRGINNPYRNSFSGVMILLIHSNNLQRNFSYRVQLVRI